MTKASDSAILNLGDIGEENTFTSTTGPGNTTSTVHSFEDKLPDSALDPDDEGNKTRSHKIFYIFVLHILPYDFHSLLKNNLHLI